MPKRETSLSRTANTNMGRMSAQRTRAVTNAMAMPSMTSVAAKVAADTLASNIVNAEAKLAKLWESAKANESPICARASVTVSMVPPVLGLVLTSTNARHHEERRQAAPQIAATEPATSLAMLSLSAFT